MITKSKAYSFNIFGFHFLIWKKEKQQRKSGIGGIVEGSCKVIRHNDFIALAMPDGTLIPHQIDLKIESNLHEAATATVKLFVSMDKPVTQ
jgi:hypothetical protein